MIFFQWSKSSKKGMGIFFWRSNEKSFRFSISPKGIQKEFTFKKYFDPEITFFVFSRHPSSSCRRLRRHFSKTHCTHLWIFRTFRNLFEELLHTLMGRRNCPIFFWRITTHTYGILKHSPGQSTHRPSIRWISEKFPAGRPRRGGGPPPTTPIYLIKFGDFSKISELISGGNQEFLH